MAFLSKVKRNVTQLNRETQTQLTGTYIIFRAVFVSCV